ncbi:hypothetical protein HDA40_005163 [Hamadaea flava]|uniref:Uncharacterized protein n=1 Tax=Hamadaea flava TaxID=1742688 RepID=A0ABV8LHZ5_9ACTN|nr:hypothetical protein [Hamadaea flava]MCP2326656.1 hypothetical protein [Hamadaea flava]
MAGLGALISCPPSAADALADALAARGSDVARHRAGSATLIVRAALPIVHELDGCVAVVDGVAELSALLSAYRQKGPSGLLGGPDPYALILRDPKRHGLMLARNGDGPPLYYAQTVTGILVASEPEALLAAGVPAVPDQQVVADFLDTGACDASDRTFYTALRRVLPGQVLALDIEVTDHTPAVSRRPRAMSARMALRWAITPGRLGVRLTQGPVSAAVYGATEAAEIPVKVIAESAQAPLAGKLDLAEYVADVGEPLPDLESYLIWDTARRVAGEIDALLDAAPPGTHLARLADRVGSRYGVELRFPRCDAAADADWSELAVSMPPVAPPPSTADVLRRIGPDLAASVLHGAPSVAAVGQLGALLDGDPSAAEALFRRHVLAYWLARHAPATPAEPPPDDVVAGGRTWRRTPVETDILQPGDPLPEKLAWYVAETASGATEPWYVLVSAKAVAVTQGRVRPVWEITPGIAARCVSALTGEPPWLAQSAIAYGSGSRAIMAAFCGRLRLARLADRFVTAPMRAVRPPRDAAAGAGRIGVTGPPRYGDDVAQEVLDTLAKVLTEAEYAQLAGCAVVGPTGLWGWAGPGTPDLVSALGTGDPFGDRRTPVVLAFAQPLRAARTPAGRKPSRRPRR